MKTVNLQPFLENDLVMLRPLTGQDSEALYRVAKDPLIWEQHTDERYKRDVFSTFFKKGLESGGALVIIGKEDNEVIGTSRYQPVDGVEGAVEIGWTFLARKYWGGEYNQAVKKLMIGHAFQFFNDIILYIDIDNFRSQKAAEKMGAVQLSSESEFHLIRRDKRDLTYRISKKEWQKQTNS